MMVSSVFLVALGAIPSAYAGDYIPWKSTGLAVTHHATATPSATPTPMASHETGGATYTVQVGRNPALPKENQLVFNPETVIAQVGDVVTFKFYPKNHTVNRATFDAPCQDAAESPIFSGFVPVKGDIGSDAVSETTFSITIKDMKPIWLYCAQGNHCGAGMVGVINPPHGRTVEDFKAKAKEVGKTVVTPAKIVAGEGGKLETCGNPTPPASSEAPVASDTGAIRVPSSTGGVSSSPSAITTLLSTTVSSVGVPVNTGSSPASIPAVSSPSSFSAVFSPSSVPAISSQISLGTGSPQAPIPTGFGGSGNVTRSAGTPIATGPAQFTGAASSFTIRSGTLGALVALFALFL